MIDAPWTSAIPVLMGEIVHVREVATADAAALAELLTDPVVIQHVSPPPRSTSAFESFIEWSQEQRARGRGVCFGIVPHGLGAAVGIIQVRALEPSFFTAEWGFALGSAFWGTGTFIDAANLVAQFAFESMGVHRIEARAVESNGRGNGALQKIGAKAEGSLARAFKRDGGYLTQMMWGLTADDWRQRPLMAAPFRASDSRAEIAAAILKVREMLEANWRGPQEPGVRPQGYFLTHSDEE
jgi:ribosomal-protein-alanine N-acetyltransferase